MRILIKSLYLFILGIYVDSRQKSFDGLLERCFKKSGTISSPALINESNRCYELYSLFNKYEDELRREISMKSLLEKNI